MESATADSKSQEFGIEKTQKQFDDYIETLPNDDTCKYSGDMIGVVVVCNNPMFKCKFRKKETYRMHGQKKHECDRPRIIRLKKILGAK